jgi:hypothetical protein
MQTIADHSIVPHDRVTTTLHANDSSSERAIVEPSIGGAMRYRVVACSAALIVCGCAAEPVAPPPAPPAPPASAPVGLPVAADGQNVGACADGECEVLVIGPVTLPLPPGSAVTNLRVESIDGERVRLAGSFPGGRVTSSGCSVEVRSGTGGTGASFGGRCGREGRLMLDTLTVAVLAVEGGAAVVKIAPR